MQLAALGIPLGLEVTGSARTASSPADRYRASHPSTSATVKWFLRVTLTAVVLVTAAGAVQSHNRPSPSHRIPGAAWEYDPNENTRQMNRMAWFGPNLHSPGALDLKLSAERVGPAVLRDADCPERRLCSNLAASALRIDPGRCYPKERQEIAPEGGSPRMKRIALLLAVLIVGVADHVASPQTVSLGPDLRSMPYAPRVIGPMSYLCMRVECIEAVPTKSLAKTIDQLRAQISAEAEDDRRERLKDQLEQVQSYTRKTADWIIWGPGIRTGPSAFSSPMVALRINKRFHHDLRGLALGDYVLTTRTDREDDGSLNVRTEVRLVGQPKWWREPTESGASVPSAEPALQHPALNRSSLVRYGYHSIPANARKGDIADVVACTLPAVFTYSTPGGTATGFTINEEGIALTTRHVVEQDREFEARFADGRSVRGVVIGVTDSPNADLALVDLDGEGYPFAYLDPSVGVKLGEEIIVIGAPAGMEHTVSKGIVSSFRQMDGVRIIQTDAPANPGNSGGPVISRDGAVVGVQACMLLDTEGVNFAISIDEAMERLPLSQISTP